MSGGREFSRTRVLRHVVLGGLSVAITILVYRLTPPPDGHHRLSMGTAYASLTIAHGGHLSRG